MKDEKYKVLVIDDEESMRDSCCLILAREGFETDTAENGTVGLQKIRENNPDFVLIDLKMPGTSGLEVLDKVKEFNPDIIPIVITGYATVESAVDAMKKGAYDFLPKPFSPEELRLIIKRGIERKNLIQEAESLRREKKLMEENFVTLVSHQLRSPMVATAQYLETILSGAAGEIGSEQKNMLQKARARLEGLLELTNDWLSMARVNSGKLEEKYTPVNLEEMISKLIEFLRPLAEDNQIKLELSPSEGNPIVLGDQESLEQVFSNLITNAIIYNNPLGSAIVSIKETPDNTCVEIRDTGVGIAAEHLPYIFDQFYQVDRSKRHGDKGSGLGLSIAKKIVETHGGSIRTESTFGKGSTFTVLLPKAA
jgi:two-component system sensor histidine kinase/response regulator